MKDTNCGRQFKPNAATLMETLRIQRLVIQRCAKSSICGVTSYQLYIFTHYLEHQNLHLSHWRRKVRDETMCVLAVVAALCSLKPPTPT